MRELCRQKRMLYPAYTRVQHTGTGNSRYREFFIFFMVSEPVLGKIGTGKKSRNRYRKKMVSEKSLGTGIGKIWYRKKSRNWYRKYLIGIFY